MQLLSTDLLWTKEITTDIKKFIFSSRKQIIQKHKKKLWALDTLSNSNGLAVLYFFHFS